LFIDSICINYNIMHIVNLYGVIGLHLKMEQYHISADFWNQTHINKIKQPKGLSLPNSEPERVPILVKQFSTGMNYQI